MPENGLRRYKVLYSDLQRPSQSLDYDDNPDHHGLHTCEEAATLAQEYLRRGHTRIEIREENFTRDLVILVDETDVTIARRDPSDAHFSEWAQMRADIQFTAPYQLVYEYR